MRNTLRHISVVLAALQITVLSLGNPAALCAADAVEPPVSLQRPGYGSITLNAPSQRPGDGSSADLVPQSGANSIALDTQQAAGQRSSTVPLVTIGSSLTLVLGLFAALVWVSRKANRAAGRGGVIPDEALRLLGQKSLGTCGSIALLRCGRSVLVVGISSVGMQPLANISDDEEVRHLEALCKGESAASFQATLSEMQREPAGRGFIGEGSLAPQARKKLFSDR